MSFFIGFVAPLFALLSWYVLATIACLRDRQGFSELKSMYQKALLIKKPSKFYRDGFDIK
jgi:hypothetical protein